MHRLGFQGDPCVPWGRTFFLRDEWNEPRGCTFRHKFHVTHQLNQRQESHDRDEVKEKTLEALGQLRQIPGYLVVLRTRGIPQAVCAELQ